MADLTQSLIESNVEYPALVGNILSDLASGRSIAITGLSNSGKSTLMRTLASKPVVQAYENERGRQANLLYIDCNRAVALSA